MMLIDIDTFEPVKMLSAALDPAPVASAESSVQSRAIPASCGTTVTPSCLQALYGIPTARATNSKNVLAVSGFIEQFANQADLTTFLKALRPDLPSTTAFTLQTPDGGTNSQSVSQAGIEANLDTQYTVGVASGVRNVFISVGNNFKDAVSNMWHSGKSKLCPLDKAGEYADQRPNMTIVNPVGLCQSV
ncbi:hypothetical protein D9619_001200 [Psilocybe cf. subviscida]|uniref:Uncharacterized protein n=1 Tax=Psilocybe cf. subviscida TaxID=2480587 RepID=A0A8H5F231_9AGAR|nr:hypothetical protein D9619_001200 [Psilocybe cf. subviscida]